MITDKGALLLIGAGTSLQFGLPSGEQLFEKITTQLGVELRNSNSRTALSDLNRACLYNDLYFVSDPQILPLLPAIALGCDLGGDEVFKIARTLHSRLCNQTSETIDDFIFQNPDLSEATKSCVATCVFNCLYKWNSAEFLFNLKKLETRQLEVRETDKPGLIGRKISIYERNWVHLLINIAREGVRTEAINFENKIKIVTFNYDMVLEYILEKQFSNVSNDLIPEGNDWADYIEIAHVHGRFDGMESEIVRPYDLISKWSSAFVVIHQTHNLENVEAERARAIDLVMSSRRFYATGFSFSASNVELIKLMERNSRASLDIHYNNYDGNIGLRTSLSRLEVEQVYDAKRKRTVPFYVRVHPVEGTPEKPMSVVDWFKAGIPGRPPS